MDQATLVRLVSILVWILPILILAVGYRFVLRVFGVVMVPEDSIGIVNKKFVLVGQHRSLPDGAVIALNAEAGIQADTLPPGVHFWLWPWQYQVTLQQFVTVPQGQLGIVEARDGRPIPSGRVLAKRIECDSFQSARAFISGGGERGPQIAIIPPGTYRINTIMFSVASAKAFDVADNMVGIVTTKEGKPLTTGEIAGAEVPGHSMYQDAQAFIDAGGTKGLQEQVMLSGRYYINPLFATVEIKEMTSVPIAFVGVVIAYVGKPGKDVTGDLFKHGNLCSKGEKGVWVEPLDPGKYAINPYTHKVEIVPTANVVLNWASGKTESHMLDKNLSTITVRSSDGFTFNLDVSQIIHIPRTDAPKVIARFGNMPNLVTQVLEPTIGNYFRNAAQGSDAIDFLKQRQQRQHEAKESIVVALESYNVNAVDTLIGDITPPDALMKTLTDRKIAEQQRMTFETQKVAETERQKLAQAKALADTQPEVVAAERSVQVAEFTASATVKTAEGQKSSAVLRADGEAQANVLKATGEGRAKVLQGNADAEVARTVGTAQAEATLKIGTAEADVVKLKIASMEAGNFAGIEIAKALAKSTVPLVPEVMAGSGSDSGSSMIALLLAGQIREAQQRNGKSNGKSDEPPVRK